MTLEDRAVRLSKPDLIRLLSAVYGVEAYVDDINQLKTNAVKTFEAFNQGNEKIDQIDFKTV